MSHKIYPLDSEYGLIVTAFFGGQGRGPCLNFMSEGDNQAEILTYFEVRDLYNALREWLKAHKKGTE